MSDKFENTGENSRSRSARCMHYVGKTLSIAVKVLAVALIAFLVIRMFTSKPPASMKKLIWNENLLSVYTSTDGQTEILTVVSSESFSTDRMFSVYSIYYIPEAGQLQFTVRYNNRALNYLEEDFPGAKETEGEIYGFRLRDNFGNEITGYSYTEKERFGYTFRRLIFEGVSLDDVSAMYVDVYYTGDENKQTRHSIFVYKHDYNLYAEEHSAPESPDGNIITAAE